MVFWDKLWIMLKGLLTSRKFWALIASLVTIAAGFSTGEVLVWNAVQAAVAAFAVYFGAVALEDGLSRRG